MAFMKVKVYYLVDVQTSTFQFILAKYSFSHLSTEFSMFNSPVLKHSVCISGESEYIFPISIVYMTCVWFQPADPTSTCHIVKVTHVSIIR